VLDRWPTFRDLLLEDCEEKFISLREAEGIFCGVLASVELLKNGGRFTTPSKVPVPVAVGTTIAGRPRRDPCERNYRTRLLPRMSGVETHVRIRMQDASSRYPSFEGRANTSPTWTAALTATPKHGTPQDAQPVAETP